MKTDPAASMRCWAITVQVDRQVFEIPALPAADWWPVLISATPLTVLDLCPELDLALIDGRVTGDLVPVLKDAIEEAAGRSFHAALVLAHAADSRWAEFSGTLAQRGFRWDVAPLGAALDAIYALCIQLLGNTEKPEAEIAKFERILDDESLTGGKRKVDPDRQMAAQVANAGPVPTSGVRSSDARYGGERPRTRRQPRPDPPRDRSTGPSSPPV